MEYKTQSLHVYFFKKTLERFSTLHLFFLLFGLDTNHLYQQRTNYASAVRKIVGNAFSGNLET